MIDLTLTQAGLLVAAIGLVAWLYSSVGHGGATGYLALMALFGISPAFARPGALWMNCAVAIIAFTRFHRADCFDSRLFLWLATASVPMAWVGSRLPLTGTWHGVILGLGLASAGVLLAFRHRTIAEGPQRPVRGGEALLVGGLLGLLAGSTGIGGGVFLSPWLIFRRWTSAKTAGGVAALFIVVNSAAGLVGLGARAWVWDPVLVLALGAGIAGALTGAYQGARCWSVQGFRTALAVVLWIGAGKLLWGGH